MGEALRFQRWHQRFWGALEAELLEDHAPQSADANYVQKLALQKGSGKGEGRDKDTGTGRKKGRKG